MRKHRDPKRKKARELTLSDHVITLAGPRAVVELRSMGGLMGEWDVEVTVTDGDFNTNLLTYPASRRVEVK